MQSVLETGLAESQGLGGNKEEIQGLEWSRESRGKSQITLGLWQLLGVHFKVGELNHKSHDTNVTHQRLPTFVHDGMSIDH